MENKDLELRMYIPITLNKDFYPNLPSKKQVFAETVITSPVVGISNEQPVCANGPVKIDIADLFKKMDVSTPDFLDEANIMLKWFYPYGIVLSYSDCDADKLTECVCSFMESVNLRDILSDETDVAKPNYTIDYYPIYFFICNTEEIYKRVCEKLSIYPTTKKIYQIDNPVVVFKKFDSNSENVINAIDLSMKITSVVYGLCYQIRIKLGAALNSKLVTDKIEYSDEVLEIRTLCSIAKELCSNGVVKTNVEKRIYSEIMDSFNVNETLFQIDNSIETLEHIGDMEITQKTDKINTTVFITGYLGLILAVYAFLPVNLGDLLSVKFHDVRSFLIKLAIFIGILGLTVLICSVLYWAYNKIQRKRKKKNAVKKIKERPEKKNKVKIIKEWINKKQRNNKEK